MGLFDKLLKKFVPAEEPEAEAPTMGAIHAHDTGVKATYNRKIKVAGVTYKNEDGTSRHKILADIKKKRPPFDKRLNVTIEEYEYEGRPAYYVKVNGFTVGTVESSMSNFISGNQSRLAGVSDFYVGDFEDEETGKTTYYARAKIAVIPKE